jgi:hypothetical protein
MGVPTASLLLVGGSCWSSLMVARARHNLLMPWHTYPCATTTPPSLHGFQAQLPSSIPYSGGWRLCLPGYSAAGKVPRSSRRGPTTLAPLAHRRYVHVVAASVCLVAAVVAQSRLAVREAWECYLEGTREALYHRVCTMKMPTLETRIFLSSQQSNGKPSDIVVLNIGMLHSPLSRLQVLLNSGVNANNVYWHT